MIVVDVALQGFRDLRGSAEVQLQAGYNGVVCVGVRPETFAQGLVETLYGPSRRGVAGEQTGTLTLSGPGDQTFRLVRDLARGGTQIFRFDGGFFAPAGDDVGELARVLYVPTRDAFDAAYSLSQADLPSAGAAARALASQPMPASERHAAEARLAQLEAVLAQRARVRELEYELDGLQKRKFEIDDTLKARSVDPEHVRAAEAELARLAYYQQVPDDFDAVYEAAMRKEHQRAADLARWHQEREELERLMRAAVVEPIARDWRLWAGLGVGATAVATGVLLGGAYRYASFLNIPALGLSALALWQNLTLREELSVAKKRLELSDRRRERIEGRDTEEIDGARRTAQAAGLSSVEEVQRLLAQRRAANARLDELHRAARAAENDPELTRMREERSLAEARIQRIEQELSSFTSSTSELLEMEQEARTLRARLGRGAPVVEAPRPRFAALLDATEQLLGLPRAECVSVLSQRGAQFAAHLSNKRIARVDLDGSGNATVTMSAKSAPLDELAPTAQDLAYLAVRGALLSAVSPDQRMPLVATPLTAAAPNWASLVRAYLALLAQAGLQVIYAVPAPEDCAGAPTVVRFEVPT